MLLPQCDCVCPECDGRLEIVDADHNTLDVICQDCDCEFSLEHSEVYGGSRIARDFLSERTDCILADC